MPETLENNVAVLRLALKEDSPPSILNVVTLYSADRFETGEELDEEVAEELTKQEEEEDERWVTKQVEMENKKVDKKEQRRNWR